MQLPSLTKGVLLRRYKRFLADIEVGNKIVTVHCPNTGAMTGCAEPGSDAWISESDNPKRKYPHTLEIVNSQHGLVSVNTGRANHLVGEALEAGKISAFKNVLNIKAEATVEDPQHKSRFDFRFDDQDTTVWVEVKSATLIMSDGVGAFPDAVSSRALKHVKALQQRVLHGERGVLLFCAQHTGIQEVQLASHIDAEYAQAVLQAMQQGVEVLAYGCSINLPTATMEIDRALPFVV